MRRKNLAKILKISGIYVPMPCTSPLLYHFGFEILILWMWRGNVLYFLDAPQLSQFGYCSLMSIFTYHLIISYHFCFVNLEDKNRFLSEKINVFHDLPWWASIAIIFLNLASPSCRFSLGPYGLQGLRTILRLQVPNGMPRMVGGCGPLSSGGNPRKGGEKSLNWMMERQEIPDQTKYMGD